MWHWMEYRQNSESIVRLRRGSCPTKPAIRGLSWRDPEVPFGASSSWHRAENLGARSGRASTASPEVKHGYPLPDLRSISALWNLFSDELEPRRVLARRSTPRS